MIIIMLFASFSRMHLKKYNIKDVFYYSFGEFINVNYVTNYYINNTYNLKYGKTYTIDVITSVLPKKLYPKKSQQLSTEFMHTVNSNYGLAFNPIAEGLVNFGNKCVYILLPLVLFFYIKLAYIIGKKYNFIYFIFVAENINFMRGQFSNSIFLIAFIGIVVGLIINSSIVSKYTSKKRQ